jgi:hypothetical protein
MHTVDTIDIMRDHVGQSRVESSDAMLHSQQGSFPVGQSRVDRSDTVRRSQQVSFHVGQSWVDTSDAAMRSRQVSFESQPEEELESNFRPRSAQRATWWPLPGASLLDHDHPTDVNYRPDTHSGS